jgi:hypothetical protein
LNRSFPDRLSKDEAVNRHLERKKAASFYWIISFMWDLMKYMHHFQYYGTFLLT